MSDPIVRTAVDSDLADILDLFHQLHPDDPKLTPDAAHEVWQQLLTSGFTHVFVVVVDERAIASCTLAIVPNLSRGGRPYGVIENVITDKAHRRAGHGRTALRAAIGKAFDAGCYKVSLASGSKQEATLSFYESSGFERGLKTYFETRQS